MFVLCFSDGASAVSQVGAQDCTKTVQQCASLDRIEACRKLQPRPLQLVTPQCFSRFPFCSFLLLPLGPQARGSLPGAQAPGRVAPRRIIPWKNRQCPVRHLGGSIKDHSKEKPPAPFLGASGDHSTEKPPGPPFISRTAVERKNVELENVQS